MSKFRPGYVAAFRRRYTFGIPPDLAGAVPVEEQGKHGKVSAVVSWCRGAVVPWCRGAVVPLHVHIVGQGRCS